MIPHEMATTAFEIPGRRVARGLGIVRGIVVRSGDKLGMPNFLRITIGLPAENRELVAALEAELPVWRERAPVPA